MVATTRLTVPFLNQIVIKGLSRPRHALKQKDLIIALFKKLYPAHIINPKWDVPCVVAHYCVGKLMLDFYEYNIRKKINFVFSTNAINMMTY